MFDGCGPLKLDGAPTLFAVELATCPNSPLWELSSQFAFPPLLTFFLSPPILDWIDESENLDLTEPLSSTSDCNCTVSASLVSSVSVTAPLRFPPIFLGLILSLWPFLDMGEMGRGDFVATGILEKDVVGDFMADLRLELPCFLTGEGVANKPAVVAAPNRTGPEMADFKGTGEALLPTVMLPLKLKLLPPLLVALSFRTNGLTGVEGIEPRLSLDVDGDLASCLLTQTEDGFLGVTWAFVKEADEVLVAPLILTLTGLAWAAATLLLVLATTSVRIVVAIGAASRLLPPPAVELFLFRMLLLLLYMASGGLCSFLVPFPMKTLSSYSIGVGVEISSQASASNGVLDCRGMVGEVGPTTSRDDDFWRRANRCRGECNF